MTILEAIPYDRLDKPERVIFGYFAPVNGERVDDPPEIEAVIEKAGSREVAWPDAVLALLELGSKPAAMVRVDTPMRTMHLRHEGGSWRIVENHTRLGALRRSRSKP